MTKPETVSCRPCVNCSHAGFRPDGLDYTCELGLTPPSVSQVCSDRNPRDGNSCQGRLILKPQDQPLAVRISDLLWEQNQ